MKKMLLLLIAINISAEAYWHAGTDYAHESLEYQKEANGVKDVSFYTLAKFNGYTLAILDTLDDREFCTPKGTTLNQVSSIIAKYIADNPNLWHHPAKELATWSLMKAFPCTPHKKDEANLEKAIAIEVSRLTKEYPNFDLVKVSDKLQEIYKKDEDKANKLNTPIGWELVHLKYFNKTQR